MIGTAPDPVNFIPFAGPAWKAAMVAKAVTRSGMIARSAGLAAAENAAGTALTLPLLMRQGSYVGDDTSFAEATLDILMGAGLGGAFGAGGAWWHTRGGRSWQPPGSERPPGDRSPRR